MEPSPFRKLFVSLVIWELNTSLFNHNLIDELMVFVMPIVIGDGIPLFGEWPVERQFKLIRTEKYSSRAVLLHYSLIA